MSYSNKNDLLKEMSAIDLAKLCGDESGTSINEERIVRAQDMAKNLIDARLFGIIEIDADDTPLILIDISVSLVIANLYRFQYAKSIMPNVIYRRELLALDMLEKIADGSYALKSKNHNRRVKRVSIKEFTINGLFE